MNKLKNVPIFFIVIMLFIILLNPSLYIKAAYDGMLMFAINIIPSLFPFMFLTKILSEFIQRGYSSKRLGKTYSKVFCLPKNSFDIFFLSLISGYPIGAKLISERKYDKSSAYKLCALCSNAGSIFVIGTIGASLINNTFAGVLIYISNILACIISAMILKVKYKSNAQSVFIPEIKENKNILYSSMTNSIMSIFIVGGYIIIFSVFSTAVLQLGLLYPVFYVLSKCGIPLFISEAYFVGLMEFGKGCVLLSRLGISVQLLTVLCSSLTAFGGLCVMMQSITYLKDSNISAWYFIFTKVLHLILSVIICSFLVIVFL